jgi:hypothetical protein
MHSADNKQTGQVVRQMETRQKPRACALVWSADGKACSQLCALNQCHACSSPARCCAAQPSQQALTQQPAPTTCPNTELGTIHVGGHGNEHRSPQQPSAQPLSNTSVRNLPDPRNSDEAAGPSPWWQTPADPGLLRRQALRRKQQRGEPVRRRSPKTESAAAPLDSPTLWRL